MRGTVLRCWTLRAIDFMWTSCGKGEAVTRLRVRIPRFHNKNGQSKRIRQSLEVDKAYRYDVGRAEKLHPFSYIAGR